MSARKHAERRAEQSLRAWDRMLGAATLIEKRLQSFLKSEFASTAPRFDALATLDRESEAITLSALTESLGVSNGNVTGLVNRLVDEGLVMREVDAADRRAQRVSITDAGRGALRKMAGPRAALIEALFADLADEELDMLVALIGRLGDAAKRS